jgi:hypothetical protein
MSIAHPTPDDMRRAVETALQRRLTFAGRTEMRRDAVSGLRHMGIPESEAVRLVAEWLDEFEEPRELATVSEEELMVEADAEMSAHLNTVAAIRRAMRRSA